MPDLEHFAFPIEDVHLRLGTLHVQSFPLTEL